VTVTVAEAQAPHADPESQTKTWVQATFHLDRNDGKGPVAISSFVTNLQQMPPGFFRFLQLEQVVVQKDGVAIIYRCYGGPNALMLEDDGRGGYRLITKDHVFAPSGVTPRFEDAARWTFAGSIKERTFRVTRTCRGERQVFALEPDPDNPGKSRWKMVEYVPPRPPNVEREELEEREEKAKAEALKKIG
jgi:hypothetical protein